MRSLICGAALLVASASAVAADDMPAAPPASSSTTTTTTTTTTAMSGDPMATLYGNTVKVVDANGLESHTYYAADHTFTGVAPAYNYQYKGTWAIDPSGNVCRTFDPVPPGITNPDCTVMTVHAVGDTWTDAKGGTGSIVAGVN